MRQLHLFGPVYDAPGLWGSTQWISKIPASILDSLQPYITSTAPAVSGTPVPGSSGGWTSSTPSTSGGRQQKAAQKVMRRDTRRLLRLQGRQGEDSEEEGSGSAAMSSPTAALSSALLHRVSISGSSSTHAVSESEGDGLDSDMESGQQELEVPWWKRRWGKELTADPETKWLVTSHCKRRTQMYHSLLHYKLRLLLKIRERVRQRSLRTDLSSPQMRGLGEGRGRWGAISASALLGEGFVAAEVERFEGLLEVAGQQFGGEEHSKVRCLRAVCVRPLLLPPNYA